MLDKLKKSVLLANLILLFFLYLLFLSRDVIFMLFIFIRFNELYWNENAFIEAIRPTLSMYLPLAFLDLAVRSYQKEKELRKSLSNTKKFKTNKKFNNKT